MYICDCLTFALPRTLSTGIRLAGWDNQLDLHLIMREVSLHCTSASQTFNSTLQNLISMRKGCDLFGLRGSALLLLHPFLLTVSCEISLSDLQHLTEILKNLDTPNPETIMEVNLISDGDPMTLQFPQGQRESNQLDSTGFPFTSRLKRLVQVLRVARYHQHWDTENGLSMDSATKAQGSKLWPKILLGLGVLFMVTVMVLLFLWNYKCIVIDRFCEQGGEVLTPVLFDAKAIERS
ncbi:uncharacterized protein LOC115472234 [Microcaecilia unicolor]|uniref:Uncharacterized protein LOC115472234 n=1 Tax=Microcaecilia unicolor TaxID=1415580 RepID=A0A6P7YHB9_9AMPH|nr:uncharacterized protein LOC115472234 [Microcaecilia unicolor]XP_030062294.1 uncharacterized protein LOC115472234 [Microcaecilia unicolor]